MWSWLKRLLDGDEKSVWLYSWLAGWNDTAASAYFVSSAREDNKDRKKCLEMAEEIQGLFLTTVDVWTHFQKTWQHPGGCYVFGNGEPVPTESSGFYGATECRRSRCGALMKSHWPVCQTVYVSLFLYHWCPLCSNYTAFPTQTDSTPIPSSPANYRHSISIPIISILICCVEYLFDYKLNIWLLLSYYVHWLNEATYWRIYLIK